MTAQAFLELSTRLVNDLKQWSEEATRRNALEPEQIAALRSAAELVDRVTVAATVAGPDT